MVIKWIALLLTIQLLVIYKLDQVYTSEWYHKVQELRHEQQALRAAVEGLQQQAQTNHRDIHGVVTYIQRNKK